MSTSAPETGTRDFLSIFTMTNSPERSTVVQELGAAIVSELHPQNCEIVRWLKETEEKTMRGRPLSTQPGTKGYSHVSATATLEGLGT
jgi:hypothetical protein